MRYCVLPSYHVPPLFATKAFTTTGNWPAITLEGLRARLSCDVVNGVDFDDDGGSATCQVAEGGDSEQDDIKRKTRYGTTLSKNVVIKR